MSLAPRTNPLDRLRGSQSTERSDVDGETSGRRIGGGLSEGSAPQAHHFNPMMSGALVPLL
jgi:hypothetical protein